MGGVVKVDFDEIHLHVWTSNSMIPDRAGSKDPGNQRIGSLAFKRGSKHPKRIRTREVTAPQRHTRIDILGKSRFSSAADTACKQTLVKKLCRSLKNSAQVLF